ncbi:MAM and LDL-receptor class A domain-containing protein 1-like isoform X2 [Acanthaster planci]|uniref:MAM and LDL-receptor class A domain-containing protein 1-like isoform X2 n=1 Tax=Acanthaster planci TaxID=133434 RepID=A0A8B7YZS7_ACAPL|nr:MAM and LDL-receptor class A domain-containing protein 1-like isoform X2 [Acanthaster planci]
MNRTYFVALAITILLLATCGTRGVAEERSVPLSTLDCDFDDHNFCHYTNNQYDDFDWTLNSGNTLSSGTGPDADHTTGTTSGFYIYTEASPQNPADKARIDSIKATAPAAGACVRFWYHMYGAGMGTLSVYTGDGKGGLGPSRWSKSGDSGDQWQETWMDIGPGSEFQIVFVGERGSDIESDIAVDDITVVEGQCDSGIKVSDLKCDFDSNTFCAYKNSPNDDFDWLLNRGSTLSSGTGPDVDHTTGNPSGFYIYIEASPQNPGDQARLDAVKATAPASGACVRFWYHMYGAGMGTLSVYTGDDEGGLGPSRWSKSGDSGNVWQEASINICCGHEFQITFIGERGSSTESDMAVDDIIVLKGQCDSNATLSDLNCDFDSNTFCAYKNSPNDDFDWLLNRGSTLSSGTGPDVDHTTGNPSGFYIYTEASPQNPADKARIDSIKATAPAVGACVRFWYHMYGAGMGTLSVYTGDGKGGLGPSRWSKSGDSGDQWQETWMDIGPGSEFQIIFAGERGSGIESDIAVDDITVVEGQCDSGIKVSDLRCDFDSNTFCAYKNSPNDDFDWLLNRGSTLSSGTGPDVDHTTGYPSGFYIYIEASPQNPGDQARLDAVRATAPATGACVRFWYHMHGAGMGTLSVYTGDDEGGLGPSRWSKSGDSGDFWQEASINICCGLEFQITFIGERGSSTESDMAVDDIIVLKGQCDSNATLLDLNCDFDSNTFCAYKNSPNDDFDWLLNRGSTLSSGTGPDVDHTTGNPSGFYIYIEASPQNPGDQARLDAVKATAPATGACVRFWYHMHGAGMGTLSVYTGDDEGGLGPSRWSKSGDSGDFWQEASINVCLRSEFQITFVGECGRSPTSDIAIDDIIVLEHQCDSTVPLSALNCNFDSGTFCSYNNSQNDDFDWILNSGSTPSYGTGPTADHTTGYSRGFYMYIEASAPRNSGDKARIDGAKAIAPATGACVRFWYHMYGGDMGSLTVYTGDCRGGLGPSRWSRKGDSGSLWRETSIDIDPNTEFSITFVGERGISFLSDIAIDDIRVQEGPCDTYIP